MVEPCLRQEHSRRHERHTRLEPEALCRTAPRPILRLADQAPGHGPSFHQDAAAHQGAARHQRRDQYRHPVSGRFRRGEAGGSPYPFDQRVEPLRSLRRHHEIPGVRKQAEGQQLYVVRAQLGTQLPEHVLVLPRPPQLCVRCDEAAGDVKVAGRGPGFGHRAISSGTGERQARCQAPMPPAFAGTLR